MTLAAGTRLGPYEILAPLGAGGMGEVYRARDTKLDREVAVKVLPTSVAADPNTLARFEREAKAVAALSHPNILSIFDFGSHDGVAFAAMELLEGETLRAKLAGGPVPQRKAVEYALQMAYGLAAAHDRGIVHRDLKPENLFVSRDGRLKILDFGLAKKVEAISADAPTSAPTDSGRGRTDPGTVMGTVSYMSPEQVKGLAVDSRSDIFSFGAVLYEMLSGERAFKRATAPETLTAILREEPEDLSGPNRRVEPALEGLVRHCLEKSPDERFQSARDLAYALSTLYSSSSAVSGATGRVSVFAGSRAGFRLAVPLGVVAGLLLGALGARLFFRAKPGEPPTYQVLTYSGKDSQPAASPDGRTVAFASSRDGTSRIWVKQLAGGAEAVLTTGPDQFPRFSPDGATLLFTRGSGDDAAIYRVPLVGGEARKVVGGAAEADWSPDGTEIGFLRVDRHESQIGSKVFRVAADGSNERLIASDPNFALGRPRWSPDGSTIAAVEIPGTGSPRPRIALFPVAGGAPKRLESVGAGNLGLNFAWNGDSRGVIVASGVESNALVSRTTRIFLRDVRTGNARTLLSGIDLRGGVDVLETGSLLLVMGGPRASLREVSPATPGDGGRWLTRGNGLDRQPVYSPDGEWIAFTSNRSGNNDIWEVSTKSGAVRRLTDDPASDFDPFFTREGKLLFSSSRSGNFEIWLAERDGSGARQVSHDGVDGENPSMTPDGQWVVYGSGDAEKRGIWKVRADGSDAKLLARGAFFLPETSPDGRFVSFLAGATKGWKIKVVRFDDGAPVPFEVAIQGGRANTGRHRWLPGGGAIAFELENEKGETGIAVQEFVPGKDTSATRRLLVPFTSESWAESLGLSPDGARLTIGERQEPASLLLVEGVEGVVARPARVAK
jgi:serine/threonine protein kinase/dipeptidyl aminopeptidase/acylaminoacyl peptidase